VITVFFTWFCKTARKHWQCPSLEFD